MSDGLTFDLDANTRSFETAMDRAKSVASISSAQISTAFGGVKTKIDGAFAGNALDSFDKRLVATTTHAQALKAKLDGIKGQAVTSFAAGQTTSVSGLASQVVGAGGLKNFAALSGGALGVTALAAGVVAAQATEYAALQRTADEAGVTASQVSGLQNILGKLGVSSTDVSSMLTHLATAMLDAKAGTGEAKAAFEAAGIAFQNADGSLRPTIDVLQDVEQYLRGTASETDKAKLATAAFGDTLGGEFSTAVKGAGSSLDDLRHSTEAVGSAIQNDLASAASNAIGVLGNLYEKMDQYYSRFKELAGLGLSDKDKSNVAQEHLDEAIGAKNNLSMASNFRDVSPEEVAAANKRIFDAAAENDKANPVRVLQGGDPRETPTPTPPARPASTDDSAGTSAGHAQRQSNGDTTDRVDTVINSLAREAAAEKGVEDALGQTDAQRQRSVDLAKAQQAASERGTALTDEERTKVLALADSYSTAKAAVEKFNEQQKAAAEGAKFLASSFESSIEGMLLSGNSLQSTMKSLLQTLESSALKALLTGEGPLAGLLGMSSSGKGASSVGGVFGLFTGLFGGLHFAQGGRVVGPGGPTSDQVPAMLSHGEFVVNAQAAGKNAGLLALINRGKTLKLAAGGLVGRLPSMPSAVAAAGGGSVSITHAPVMNVTAAHGVTPDQLARVLDANQRASDRRILSTISNARRRF